MKTLLPVLLVAGVTISSGSVQADQGASIQYLDSGKLLPKGLPFSEAVRVGNMLYLSGQIGNLPGRPALAPGGIRAESRQVMENIKTVLEAHGYGMGNLVKCTVMLADMAEWPAFNKVYSSYFSGNFPARSAFATNGLALGARVEVDCIAAVAE